jgi:hypothetical protein
MYTLLYCEDSQMGQMYNNLPSPVACDVTELDYTPEQHIKIYGLCSWIRSSYCSYFCLYVNKMYPHIIFNSMNVISTIRVDEQTLKSRIMVTSTTLACTRLSASSDTRSWAFVKIRQFPQITTTGRDFKMSAARHGVCWKRILLYVRDVAPCLWYIVTSVSYIV